MNKIVTRFAPSPTGFVHIGNIRTALFSWLYAKNMNGKFLIRIDDTDLERCSKKYINNIIDILNWLKIKSDEKIFFQSENYNIYKEFLIKLIKSGNAYKCYCSKERLNVIRNEQIKKKIHIKYDGRCKYLKTKHDNNNFVIRFNNQENGFVEFKDDIKGLIKVSNIEIDDFIISKQNYMATYNFASVIDDINLNVSNIIRGEDHISNTPKQIKIMQALNFKIPCFAHLPMILDEERRLLSKRDNNTNMVLYKNDGFLPEAILNYIVRLGWSYKNKEIFSVDEMIKFFNIKDVNKSRCIMNIKKLLWLNKHYIKISSFKNIMINLIPIEKKFKLDYLVGPSIKNLIEFGKNRSCTLKSIIVDNLFLYEHNLNLDDFFLNKYFNKDIIYIFIDIYKILKNNLFLWSLDNIKDSINNLIFKNKISLHDLAVPFRVLITGSDQPRPLYDLIFISGRILILRKIINIIRRMGL